MRASLDRGDLSLSYCDTNDTAFLHFLDGIGRIVMRQRTEHKQYIGDALQGVPRACGMFGMCSCRGQAHHFGMLCILVTCSLLPVPLLCLPASCDDVDRNSLFGREPTVLCVRVSCLHAALLCASMIRHSFRLTQQIVFCRAYRYLVWATLLPWLRASSCVFVCPMPLHAPTFLRVLLATWQGYWFDFAVSSCMSWNRNEHCAT